jgi:hypothetical protein
MFRESHCRIAEHGIGTVDGRRNRARHIVTICTITDGGWCCDIADLPLIGTEGPCVSSCHGSRRRQQHTRPLVACIALDGGSAIGATTAGRQDSTGEQGGENFHFWFKWQSVHNFSIISLLESERVDVT